MSLATNTDVKRRNRSNTTPNSHPTTNQHPLHVPPYTSSLIFSPIDTSAVSTPSSSSLHSTSKKHPTFLSVRRHSHSQSTPSIPLQKHSVPRSFTQDLFTPAEIPPFSTPLNSRSSSRFPYKKSASSPILHSQVSPHRPAFSSQTRSSTYHMSTDSGDDRDNGNIIYTARDSQRTPGASTRSNANFRSRLFGGHISSKEPKCITTTPGKLGAGETETEADEPPKHLPTSRIIPASGPLIPPNSLQQRLTPLLFEFSRLLSIVPAIVGTLYNIFRIYCPPDQASNLQKGIKRPPDHVDYYISALWAILTGYQCLRLTTGLLARWRLYYPPLPTLIRLLALQAICWPATHLTLKILEHEKRPLICWAIIGTTTCVSRSVQIWVTSNLWWEGRNGLASGGGVGGGGGGPGIGGGGVGKADPAREEKRRGYGYWKRWGGGKWGGRRWDWGEVGVQCMFPAGVVYFVMAWAGALRREFMGC